MKIIKRKVLSKMFPNRSYFQKYTPYVSNYYFQRGYGSVRLLKTDKNLNDLVVYLEFKLNNNDIFRLDINSKLMIEIEQPITIRRSFISELINDNFHKNCGWVCERCSSIDKPLTKTTTFKNIILNTFEYMIPGYNLCEDCIMELNSKTDNLRKHFENLQFIYKNKNIKLKEALSRLKNEYNESAFMLLDMFVRKELKDESK